MFEREIRDLSFVKRWGIVRTLRDQSVAEHTYFVTMYANDIATYLNISPETHLALMQQILWHDMEEIYTGDIPGPAKHALSDRGRFSAKVADWMHKTFGQHKHRNGSGLPPTTQNIVHCIIKIADYLDAACEMATEVQMGNANCKDLVKQNLDFAVEYVETLGSIMNLTPPVLGRLRASVTNAVVESTCELSSGPIVISQ
jgi:5'-deoxynucleotidase YfbR-like HD superfamily hydrolase